MATNPYVNKVVYGNQTVMDISDTDANEADVVSGKVFYKGSGARSVGTADYYSPSDTAETTIDDTDYFPFYDSSATAKRKTLWSNIKSVLNSVFFNRSEQTVLGAKNLIEYPFYNTTFTNNGITFTDNGDGSITVNGTAEAQVGFILHNSTGRSKPWEYDKDVILSGTSDGTSSTFYLVLADAITHNDYVCKDGVNPTIPASVNGHRFGLNLIIKQGATLSNKVIRPMLRLATDPDDTFVSYVPTNKQLSDYKMSYKDNGVLGAKNLLVNKASTQTVSDVTFTVNSDKSISLSGTASADIFLKIIPNEDAYTLPKGSYVLSGGRSDNIYVYLINSSSGTTIAENKSSIDDTSFTLDDDTLIRASIYVKNGTNTNNTTLKPMLRLASDHDDTYVPYAMTNRELTEKVETVYKVAQANSSGDTVIFYNVDTSKAYDLEVDLGTSWDGAIPCATNCTIQGTTVTYTLQNAQAGQSFRLIDLKR